MEGYDTATAFSTMVRAPIPMRMHCAHQCHVVPDEGHNTRIEIQQDKLDKACDLKERLEERLGKLKNEERQRELHLRKQQELGVYRPIHPHGQVTITWFCIRRCIL